MKGRALVCVELGMLAGYLEGMATGGLQGRSDKGGLCVEVKAEASLRVAEE